MKYTTVAEHFAGRFTEPIYDGSYHTQLADAVSGSFGVLSAYRINWCQVHGDFKNVVKRGMFEPYPHWSPLYDACRTILKGHVALGTQFLGEVTCARMMGEAMALLRAKHGHSVPRWWLPVMNALREAAEEKVR
jgi:hypothetical protein